jgi:Zn-dependent protease
MKLLLLFLTGAKFGKLLVSVATMLLTIWVYGQIYGPHFAAGFVGMLLVHELGHYFAARRRGLEVGLPAFIPFVGAWINLRGHPHDSETDAYVAFAGPFVGTLAAFLAFWHASKSGDDFWMALAYSGFMLNLFNMIPISPLDGGRITQVLSPKIWYLGLPILISLYFYLPSPMIILVAVMAVPNLLTACRMGRNGPDPSGYRDISDAVRYEYMAMYLGLTGFLAIMTFQSHQLLRHA